MFRPQFKLSQLLALTTLIAAVLYCATTPVSEKPLWNRGVLDYSDPEVPAAFVDGIRIPPSIVIRRGVGASYPCGRELYVANYFSGWYRCKSLFYDGLDNRWLTEKCDVDIKDLEKRKSSWRQDHVSFAHGEGFSSCRKEILRLLRQEGETELRNRMADPYYWRIAPAVAIAILSISYIAFFCPLRVRAQV